MRGRCCREGRRVKHEAVYVQEASHVTNTPFPVTLLPYYSIPEGPLPAVGRLYRPTGGLYRCR
jgi:hypothetical protein